MSSCGVCVRPFVHYIRGSCRNKRIFNFFSPSGSHTILVFPYLMGWRYSDGNPVTGASNASGVSINRDYEPISGFTASC